MSDRNDQLPELLSEEFSELRWRRDIEDRLVNWMTAICSGLLTASVAIAQFSPPSLFLTFSVLAAALIVGVSRRIVEKLEAEKIVYRHIGETISSIIANDHRIDQNDGDPPYVGPHVHKIGRGRGTERTIEIIRFASSFTALAVVTLGVAAFILAQIQK